jgi:hypothetical protein
MGPPRPSEQIAAAHQSYGHLTGQSLPLGLAGERPWYEWLRAGFTLEDVPRVVTCLQREIREGRRNVGALTLSHLRQLDRFEEDLAIRRVRLEPLPRPPAPPPPRLSAPAPELRRLRQLEQLRQLKETLR